MIMGKQFDFVHVQIRNILRRVFKSSRGQDTLLAKNRHVLFQGCLLLVELLPSPDPSAENSRYASVSARGTGRHLPVGPSIGC